MIVLNYFENDSKRLRCIENLGLDIVFQLKLGGFKEMRLQDFVHWAIFYEVGGVENCSVLCNALAHKTGSQALGAVCNSLCDMVGVEEFVKIVQRADLDPIYFCELLSRCPANNNGDAEFDQFDVTPKSGAQGTFTLTFQYTSQNGTGTGEISLEVDTIDGLLLGQSFLHELAPAGTYNGQFQLRAEHDPDCDPTQSLCEEWLHGDYTVRIALCNGECGSKHPHSAIYDETSVTFTIEKK